MFKKPPPHCSLCLEPAKFRCSKCIKEFCDFYCSPEHQKLYWTFHKYFCGKNREKFAVPELNDLEKECSVHCDRIHAGKAFKIKNEKLEKFRAVYHSNASTSLPDSYHQSYLIASRARLSDSNLIKLDAFKPNDPGLETFYTLSEIIASDDEDVILLHDYAGKIVKELFHYLAVENLLIKGLVGEELLKSSSELVNYELSIFELQQPPIANLRMGKMKVVLRKRFKDLEDLLARIAREKARVDGV